MQDHERALEFYRDLLGLEVRYDETVDTVRYVMVAAPGQDVALWLVQPQTNDSRNVRGHQSGDAPMLVLYTDDLEDAVAGLRFAKAEVWALSQGSAARSVQTRDPDGNVLMIAELS